MHVQLPDRCLGCGAELPEPAVRLYMGYCSAACCEGEREWVELLELDCGSCAWCGAVDGLAVGMVHFCSVACCAAAAASQASWASALLERVAVPRAEVRCAASLPGVQ